MKKQNHGKLLLKKEKMQTGWQKIAKENNLEISLSGIPALSSYSFKSDKALEYKTFITQEMLKKVFWLAQFFMRQLLMKINFLINILMHLMTFTKLLPNARKGMKIFITYWRDRFVIQDFNV